MSNSHTDETHSIPPAEVKSPSKTASHPRGAITTEAHAALQLEVESLSETVRGLTGTIKAQNDLIARMTADQRKSRARPPRPAARSVTPIRVPSPIPSTASSPLFGSPKLPGVPLPKSLSAQPKPKAISQPPPLPHLPQPSAQASIIRVSPTVTLVPANTNTGLHPPFPKFGRDQLGRFLRWWWFPYAHYHITKPLRSWTLEERAPYSEWKTVEIVARGWHIMKGHDVQEDPLDQVEAPTLSELAADVQAWKVRWGTNFAKATQDIRIHLWDNRETHPWAQSIKQRKKRDSGSRQQSADVVEGIVEGGPVNEEIGVPGPAKKRKGPVPAGQAEGRKKGEGSVGSVAGENRGPPKTAAASRIVIEID